MSTEVPGTARARDPTDDEDLGASTDDVEQHSVPTTLPGPHRARDGRRVPWSWSKWPAFARVSREAVGLPSGPPVFRSGVASR
jgi:hypothetical protein